MEKKILPYIAPTYRTYNYMACLDVCAQGDPRMDNWVLNYYTSWCCEKNETGNPKVPAVRIPYSQIWRVPIFFNHCRISKKYIQNCYTQVFKNFLNDGCYIYFNIVDDYYMQIKPAYKRYHYPHDGLITGYDEEKKVYYVSTYTKSGNFENVEVSFGEFNRAWHSRYMDNTALGADIIGLKLHPEEKYEPLVDKILEDIHRYVSSEVTEEHKRQDSVFGLAVYHEIERFFQAVLQNGYPCYDKRLFRLIYEHKLSMYRRLKYLNEESIVPPETVKSYKEVLDIANKTYMLHLKYLMTDNTDCLCKMHQNIREIADRESRLLSKIG